MEKSKIILHEENRNEKDLEYVISPSRPSLLAQNRMPQLNLGPGAGLVSAAGGLVIEAEQRELLAGCPSPTAGLGPRAGPHCAQQPVPSSKPLYTYRHTHL